MGQEHAGVGCTPGAGGTPFLSPYPKADGLLSPTAGSPPSPPSPVRALAGNQTRVLVLSPLLVKSPRSRAAAGGRRAHLISPSALIAAIAPCEGKVQAGAEAGGTPQGPPLLQGEAALAVGGEKRGIVGRAIS